MVEGKGLWLSNNRGVVLVENETFVFSGRKKTIKNSFLLISFPYELSFACLLSCLLVHCFKAILLIGDRLWCFMLTFMSNMICSECCYLGGWEMKFILIKCLWIWGWGMTRVAILGLLLLGLTFRRVDCLVIWRKSFILYHLNGFFKIMMNLKWT